MNVRTLDTGGILDRIVIAAAEKGIIDRSVRPRTQYFKDLEKLEISKSLLHTLALRCPPQEELDKLLTLSMDLEKATFPEFYNSKDGEEAHRRSFDKLIKKHAFCDVDNDLLLQNVTSWDQVVASLASLVVKE